MHAGSYSANGERSLASLIAEIRDELKSVVTTRVEMLKAELREAMTAIAAGLPLALVAAVMVATAYLLLTLSLVALIVVAFGDNPYRWFFAFLIVGFAWLILGGMAAFFVWNQFREHSFVPKKTVEVLKADKAWLQSEIRGAV